MLRLATDEDFNNRIVRGLLRRNPDLDIVRAQDAGLRGRGDLEVLEVGSCGRPRPAHARCNYHEAASV
jgi:hypothetical protein